MELLKYMLFLFGVLNCQMFSMMRAAYVVGFF